jgi:protein TonB
MEVKKSQKASLENKRLLFVEIGFVLALLAVLFAFEWSSKEKADSGLLAENKELIEEEIIPITQETPPPPPEAPKIPILSDQIDIIDDNIKVDNDMVSLDDNADL